MYVFEQDYIRQTDAFSAHFLEMCTHDLLISCVDMNYQYAEHVHKVFSVNQQLITLVYTYEKELIEKHLWDQTIPLCLAEKVCTCSRHEKNICANKLTEYTLFTFESHNDVVNHV